MTPARQRASARLAARFGKAPRLAVVSSVATLAVVATGVAAAPAPDAAQAQSGDLTSSLDAAAPIDAEQFAQGRMQQLSRSASRTEQPIAQPVALRPKATAYKFATAPLNLWTAPREDGRRLGLVPWAGRVRVTGQVVGHWAEVLVGHGDERAVRWVNADFLANRKPKPEPEPQPEPQPEAQPQASTSTGTPSASAPAAPPSTGLSTAPCPDGSSIESGLTSAAVGVYRAVCAAFAAPTTYGGYDAHGEHADGRAIDIMISGSTGQQIADWLRANAGALGIRDVIFAQHIWTPERAAEGWRYMASRGSATANHYDHVHVAVY